MNLVIVRLHLKSIYKSLLLFTYTRTCLLTIKMMFFLELLFIMNILPIINIFGQQPVKTPDQTICYEMVNSPDNNPLWTRSGLDMNVDFVIKCGDIVAYKLLWSSTGEWSDWFVTGLNDLSPPGPNNRTRMWSWFSDYYHIFIICKSNSYKRQGADC